MSDKRIKVININKSVPKKTKIVQSKNETPSKGDGSLAEAKPRKPPRPRRAATSRKKPETESKKISIPPEAGGVAEPLDDAIRLRAYFISERRRRFALPGDAESDWLEAKRQLLFETG